MRPRSFLAAVVVVATPALAVADNKSDAEAMFRQGRDLMTKSKFAQACDAFAASQQLDPAPTTLLNLGACREKNNQLASAWIVFVEVERNLRSQTDAASQQLHDVAAGKVAKLEPRLSKLMVTVPAESAVAGLEVKRDGAPVPASSYNFALPIDGGTYKIFAGAPGKQDFATTVVVKTEGDAQEVRIPTLAVDPKAVAGGAKPGGGGIGPIGGGSVVVGGGGNAGSHASHTVPLVLGGAAIVLAGGATGFALWGASTIDKARTAATIPARHGEVDSLWKSANTKTYVAEAMGIGAVGCAAAAVVLYLRGNKESATPPSGRTAFAPLLAPDTVGISFAGSL